MSSSQTDDSYDSDFPYPHLDDPHVGEVRYIGVDKAIVERQTVPESHWSEKLALGYHMEAREPFELGDESADHIEQQGYDNWEEE